MDHYAYWQFLKICESSLLEVKGGTCRYIYEIQILIENQCDRRINCIRSDNGKEYVNRKFGDICRNMGIRQQSTVPYWQQQNGIAERMNRSITERARSMLSYINMGERGWAEAINTAVYLINGNLCSSSENTNNWSYFCHEAKYFTL